MSWARRLMLGAGLLLVGVLALVLLEARAGPKTYEAERFSFSYPDDWQEVELALPLAGESELGEHTVGPDDDNWVTVGYTRPNDPPVVARGNVDQLIPHYTERFTELSEQVAGELLSPPAVTDAAAPPGIELRIRVPAESGPGEAVDRITTLWAPEGQFGINCHHSEAASAELEQELASGCELIVESFRAHAAAAGA